MMMKRLIILVACLGLAGSFTGCTSRDGKKDDAEVTADIDSADLEKLEGDDSLSTDSLASDSLAEDALGESTPQIAETTTETTTTTTEHSSDTSDVATTESLPADPLMEPSFEAPPTETSSTDSSTTIVDSTTSEPAPMLESTTSTETSTSSTSSSSYGEEKPVVASAPLQKVATTPWQVKKTWYNTVYFARPGDSLSKISKTIYGKGNKVAELKRGNPTFNSRDVKPGDKVYYNSPNRPDDSARMLTYFEDNGIQPETYVAKSGDNIRTVSKKLLSYPNAWKEVWATNSVESKTDIAEGTELRYWSSAPVAAAPAPHQEIAAAPPADMPPPPAPDMAPPPAPDMAANDMAPPPAPDMNMPPPPDVPPMDQAAADLPPPPPPMPEAEMAPPPPPPPPPPAEAPHHDVAQDASPLGGMDNDTTMALAVVGLAAAGLAILIVMRKKRKQREMEAQNLNDTHVG